MVKMVAPTNRILEHTQRKTMATPARKVSPRQERLGTTAPAPSPTAAPPVTCTGGIARRCTSISATFGPDRRRRSMSVQVLYGVLHHSLNPRMGSLKRKRVEALPVPTFSDVHPRGSWSLGVRVYHKYHVERFAPSRKRLNLVLLDEQGTKMVAIIYDDQVDRLDPLLREGSAYYVSRMSIEPARMILYQWLADHAFVCVFTRDTTITEIANMHEKILPLLPPLMPLDQVFEFTYHNDIYVDVIGMVIFVSSIGFVEGYKKRIPYRNILIIDGSFKPVMLVIKDKMLTDHLTKWARCSNEQPIIVATMLRAKREEDHSLHTTCFSRVQFDPNVAVARELRKRLL
ncbi:Os10g0186800 [Oryza sativa Japonica Group]|uniref:Os10g0186800 protein n=1 Tax=Oryza sativa subsp. japonica TaxID=39947 RepID=Q0IYN9_ORYSJ|nr:Os10g0186800 [Oryza sativa Japonica Group]|eukprot:NP_001064262.1 Os10g0186800 [Oryza sativa Japonica Group]